MNIFNFLKKRKAKKRKKDKESSIKNEKFICSEKIKCEEEVEKAESDMFKLQCPFVGKYNPCHEKCIHFKSGYIYYNYMYPVYSIMPYYVEKPCCKLWKD